MQANRADFGDFAFKQNVLLAELMVRGLEFEADRRNGMA